MPGSRVLVLEVAPKPLRGGTSRHTRNFRCRHAEPLGPLIESYGEDEYFADLLKVTDGKTDTDLARLVIRESESCLAWMDAHVARFPPPLAGTLSLARTNAFFGAAARDLSMPATGRLPRWVLICSMRYGLGILTGSAIGSWLWSTNTAIQSTVSAPRRLWWPRVASRPTAIGWRGPAARSFLIRGTPYNRGEVLADLFGQGIDQIGDPRSLASLSCRRPHAKSRRRLRG